VERHDRPQASACCAVPWCRDAAFVLNITASWERADDDGVNIEWARAAYGKNYERLIEIKTKWDPQNFFRMNKNIAPRA
jgi:hypothetical protein